MELKTFIDKQMAIGEQLQSCELGLFWNKFYKTEKSAKWS